LGIAAGLFQTYLPSTEVHQIGATQVFCVVLVFAFLGQIVAARERAETALESEERRE